VAGLIDADLLLILSDVDGLYDKNPIDNNDANLIDEVKFINEGLLNYAGKSVSNVGTGGMKSKIIAAKKEMDSGCYVGIINGKEPENIMKFLNGEHIGTFFSHMEDPIKRKKLWIAYAAIPKGNLIIDSGAVKALVDKKKSLLPSGIKKITGKFSIGDIVSVLDEDGNEIARGKIRYSAQDIKKIMGKKTSEIIDILGYKFSDEVIHRDDMVIFDFNGGFNERDI
jgi:glutamate 5-kinase